MEFNGLKNQSTMEKNIFNEKIKEKRGYEIMYGTVACPSQWYSGGSYVVNFELQNDAQAKWLGKNYSEFKPFYVEKVLKKIQLYCDKKEDLDRLLREFVETNKMCVKVGDFECGYVTFEEKYDEFASQIVDLKLLQVLKNREKESEEIRDKFYARKQGDDGVTM